MKSCSIFFFLFSLIAQAAPLAITNHQDQEIIRYEVALLRGTLEEGTAKLTIKNAQAPTKSKAIQPVIHGGKFKALIPLSPGKNTLFLSSDRSEQPLIFTLEYKPQINSHFVRLIWLTDKDGDLTYATPTDNTPQDYKSRLRTAARIMQTFTAEKMHENGHGRRTFRLERDAEGEIIIHTLKGQLSKGEYYLLGDSGQYWSQVRKEVNAKFPDQISKNIVLAAFTRKSSTSGKMMGHTALGGANLGLFGSASIFSWPQDISDVAKAFQNSQAVDPTRVHDDSAGRGVYWGLASTTIGATLHELGHTFGLMHSSNPKAIMSRGFDRFNRTFTFADPPSKRSKAPIEFKPHDEATFCPAYATSLRWSNWFNADLKDHQVQRGIGATYHTAQKSVEIKSKEGIRWIGFVTDGDKIKVFREFPGENPPKSVTYTIDEMQKFVGGKQVEVIHARSALDRTMRYKIPVSKK